MITILMPIYNGIEFIDDSVSSILSQTYKDWAYHKWELIIGINGHPPHSDVYQKAKTYESDNIRVLDYPQLKGKATTLNAMLLESKYDYIALLDVDDIWMPEKLEIQSIYIHSDYDVIGSRCIYFGEQEGTIPVLPVGELDKFDFTQFNPIINSSCLVKKSLCHWNENGIEDYDLWLRLKKENRRFFNCNDILVKHRIHRASAFNSKGHTQQLEKLLAPANINTTIRIRVFSSFCDSNNCKDVYERLCETAKIEWYGAGKKVVFTNDNDYTHVVIMNTAMPFIEHIPPNRVLGLAFEPPAFLNITAAFVEYAKQRIGTYLIGEQSGLPAPFREHFGYMWHNPPLSVVPKKSNMISMVVTHKMNAPGHQLRHEIIQRILKTNLPIDIYGNGCVLYQTNGDRRMKGDFKEGEPYHSYQFHISIENFQTNHYFSEKIMNPLLVGATPIYYGARKIEDYFPGYIIPMPTNVDDILELFTNICREPAKYKKEIDLEKVKETINFVKHLDTWFSNL